VNIAVIIHPARELAGEIGAELIAAAARHGMNAAHVPDGHTVDGYDLVIGVGGDGTMLHAAAAALAADVPVIGIDVGVLGYLAEIQPQALEHSVGRIARGEYRRQQRMTLEAVLPGGESVLAINDVVVEKSMSPRVAYFQVEVGGMPFHTYRADGVILASPTGSTAYAFSAGGPIVDPRLEGLILTPVAAHDLFNRPVVFRPDSEIRITAGREREVRVNVDGRERGILEPGQSVHVTRGRRPVCFLTFGERSFVEALKQEFGLDDA
jgi:NAD+ kinase